MDRQTTSMDAEGRVQLPDTMREQLGVQPGEPLSIELDNGTIRIRIHHRDIAHAQALVAHYIPPERDLVAELIAERRTESTRDSSGT